LKRAGANQKVQAKINLHGTSKEKVSSTIKTTRRGLHGVKEYKEQVGNSLTTRAKKRVILLRQQRKKKNARTGRERMHDQVP